MMEDTPQYCLTVYIPYRRLSAIHRVYYNGGALTEEFRQHALADLR